MKHANIFAIIFIILSLSFIIGCDNDGGNDDGASSNGITGIVRGSDGTTLSDVRVMAMERTTNKEYESVTDDDGHYVLAVPDGVYDIGFETDDYTTSYYGPVFVTTGGEKNVTLQRTDGLDNAFLSGRVFDMNGNPQAAAQVYMFSNVASPEKTNASSAVTDENGYFAMTVNGEMSLDLDFETSTGLAEFVDIVKLDKPCYVEVTLGSGVENTRRHDESEDTLSLSEQMSTNTLSPNAAGQNLPFKMAFSNELDYSYLKLYGDFLMTEGELAVNGGGLRVRDNAMGLPIELKNNGDWWYDYAVNYDCLFWYLYANIAACQQLGDCEPGSSFDVWTLFDYVINIVATFTVYLPLQFTDMEPDTYHTWVCEPLVNKKISFNSKATTIVKVENGLF